MKKILGVSLVALMAVSTARADIASKAYVDNNFQNVSAIVTSISDSSTNAQYPTAKAVWDAIGSGTARGVTYADGTNGDVGSASLPVYINDGVATAITSLPVSSLTDVTATAADINKLTGLTTTATELGYVSGVTSSIQTQLDGKADEATTLAGYGITDAYTKTEVDTKIGTVPNTSDNVIDYVDDTIANANLSQYELKTNVTSKGAADTPVYFDANGVATPITSYAGNAATATSAASADAVAWSGVSNKPTTLAGYGITDAQGAITDVASTAESGKVVIGVSQTDGQISATMADPLSVTSYTDQSDAQSNVDGQYVLTKKVNGQTVTFAWELITRGN